MKKISLIKSKSFYYFLDGTGWLLYAFLSFFDNSVISIISSVVLVICLIISTYMLFISDEPEDEMSRYNLMKSKAKTLDFTRIIICALFLLASLMLLIFNKLNLKFDNISISIYRFVVFALLGVTQIITGSLFIKYEKDGE